MRFYDTMNESTEPIKTKWNSIEIYKIRVCVDIDVHINLQKKIEFSPPIVQTNTQRKTERESEC